MKEASLVIFILSVAIPILWDKDAFKLIPLGGLVIFTFSMMVSTLK